ncbi:Hypothetical predicted protein [Cloeon dipterum]|uniref:Bromo domain-containing protein n=1 Tax=Cloeon dipterum TaxID=197152 RepID=A0A8S1CT99_9INSE|nr:Hypothetical predicted protein [Cloeon dipterum]
MNSPGSSDDSSDEKGGQIPAKNEDSTEKDSSDSSASEARADDSQASTVPYVEKPIESPADCESSFCSNEDDESIHLEISCSEGEESKDPFMGISFSDNSLKNWPKNTSLEEPPLPSTSVYVDSSEFSSGYEIRPSKQPLIVSPNQKSTSRLAVSPSWLTDFCPDEDKPTSESRSSDAVRNFKPNPKMLSDSMLKEKLNRFLDVLMGHEHAPFVFSQSPSKSRHFVSERPVNMEDLRKKLNDGLFSSGEDFLRDLKLMLLDATMLNPIESGIPEKACIMEGVLSYLWSATFKHFPLKDDTPKSTSFDARAVKTSFPLVKGPLERPQ